MGLFGPADKGMTAQNVCRSAWLVFGAWVSPFCGPASSLAVTLLLNPQVAGLLPMLHDAFHRPFTMLWPTDSALQALPPDRKNWLYHEDHRDKLAAILRGHMIRNIEVGTHLSFGPSVAYIPNSSHISIYLGLGV